MPARVFRSHVNISVNTKGKDYVAGDIHGCFSLLQQGLEALAFDPTRDRLFALGDVIDRGPESHLVLEFLDKPWFHAVRGNHEDALLQLYENYYNPPREILEYQSLAFSSQWWLEIGTEFRNEFLNRVQKLPIAIELETRTGTVGLVHAKAPRRRTWQYFIRAIAKRNLQITENALWNGDTVGEADEFDVKGIDRVFVGHIPRPRPTSRGNVLFIDTGAFRHVLNKGLGALTIARATLTPQELDASELYDDTPDGLFLIGDPEPAGAAQLQFRDKCVWNP
jgi:serine/threonine protein phosphatase 1